jgi:hypothetical protein
MPDDKPLLDSDRMYAKLIEYGEAWADAKAAYQALDGATASVLADLTQGYRNTETNRAEAETMARRSPQYRDHLASVSVANKAYLRSQVRYESLKTLIELRRSEESSRRAEMRV